MTAPPESNGITLGEVYRLLKRVDGKVDKMVDEVNKHEAGLAVLEVRLQEQGKRAGKIGASLGGGIATLVAGIYHLFFSP